jgi:phage nucleotide-binding protein
MSAGLDFSEAVAEADEVLDMLMARIAPASKANPYLKVLIYGNPGVRKTTFMATAPSPLIVDVERGTTSLRNFPETRDTQVLEFRSITQVETLIQKMSEGGNALDKFQTLGVDSFSEMQKKDLDNIIRTAASSDASRNKFLPTGPDYNINTEHMRQVADSLRNLDKHIIVTCHVKEEKDDATGRILVRPNLTPKLAGTLNGIFDVVGYMSLDFKGDITTWSLQVHPTATVTAKTRIGNLPPVLVDPKFSDLLDAFEITSKENE